jgi:hypothetical protein
MGTKHNHSESRLLAAFYIVMQVCLVTNDVL